MYEPMTFEELQRVVSMCLDEIIELKQEKEQLEAQVNGLCQSLSQLISYCQGLSQNFEETKKNIATSLRIQDMGLENIRYELGDPNVETESVFYPQFYDVEDTINMIVIDHCSIARFGDGEFAIMAGHNRQKFQKYDANLAYRLREILDTKDEHFLIAIADNYGSLEKYSRAGKSGIRNYMVADVRKEHRRFLDLQRIYHNAYISRPCVLFADCETDEPMKRFNRLKTIWQNRDVVVVEGSLTRLGVGNDLFANVRGIRRILCPSENAYEKYDAILSSALQNGTDETLYLIALGPMAGVLAYDLYKNSRQAVDIGHIDLEYEWYLRGGKRCEVPGKYNNELVGGELVAEIMDEQYQSEIIDRIV